MKEVIQNGNSFDSQSVTVGHARKVWRRVEEQLPGTGMITNLADFAGAGLVRSGIAIAKDTAAGADEQDYIAIPFADIVSAVEVSYQKVSNPSGNPKEKGYYEYAEGTGYTLTEDTEVTEGTDYFEKVEAAGIDSLNILGFLLNDVPVHRHGAEGAYTYNKGTCTIIVKGEIYGYMLGDTPEQAAVVAAAVKTMTQKNGLSIRVI